MAAILFPELQFHDENGVPLASGTIETYVAGTSTPTPTYTDNTGGTSVGNSITLDAEGRPNSGNGIWLGTTTTYKFIIKDSGGNTVQTIDNISSGGFNGSSSFITATSESGLTSARVLTAGAGISITDAGAGSTMTINTQHPINSQTGASYTALAGDRGKVIRFSTQSTATLNFTAVATLGDGWYCYVANDNTSYLLLDPNSTEQINGTTVIYIPIGGRAIITCDGSRLYAFVLPRADGGGISFRTGSSSSANPVTVDSLTSNESVMVSQYYQATQTNLAEITADRNDYQTTSHINILTANGAYNITGIASSIVTSTRSTVIYLINSSAFTLTFKHESASSTAANRFKFSTGADIALAADQTIALIYDNTADRWRNIPV